MLHTLWKIAVTVALAFAASGASVFAFAQIEASAPERGVGEAGADSGAERWRSGDHTGALSLWTAALEGGADLPTKERSRLAYNLGIAEFERGEPLRAVAWFEAALRAAPRAEDARANLGIARAEAGLEPRTSDGFTATLTSLAARLTRPESEWLALCGALLLGLAGLGEALRGGQSWRRMVLVALLAQPVFFAPLVRHLALADTQPYMVIDPDGAGTRAMPSPGAERLGTLAAGSIVEYVDEMPGWTKIVSDGNERWVAASKLFDLRL